MAGRYNTWLRNKLADRIESNSGYWADRSTHFPIEYPVHFYASIDTAGEAKELLIAHGHFDNETDLNLQFPMFDEWWDWGDDDDPMEFGALNNKDRPNSDEMHSSAQESLCDDLHDDDGFKTWSPKTAARYGFDYEGPGADRSFDLTLENHGRGGKHVVLCSFEGRGLSGLRSEELAEIVRGGMENDYVSNKWCRRLMGMMDEWDVMLTDENAERCGLYHMTDYIARSMGLFD